MLKYSSAILCVVHAYFRLPVMNFTGQVLLPVPSGFQVSAVENKGFTLCHLHPQELHLCIIYSKALDLFLG